MMPQLGVLSEVHLEAALEVFNKDCLIRLGTCISPIGILKNNNLFDYTIKNKNSEIVGTLKKGELLLHKLPYELFDLEIKPYKGIDIGNGPGVLLEQKIYGGEVGIFLDGRDRPIKFDNEEYRIQKIKEWSLSTSEFSGE